MSIFDFFSSQGTATPSPDSERGDWMDWFLNREGPAGRFRGSRRPRYGIDYLFNGGGSVQSGPRRSVQSGPRTRQKLQPRSIEAIVNSEQNKQNRNQRRWEGFGGEGPYPVFNQPHPKERSHTQHYFSPGWLEASAPRDNTGIMTAAADYSPDFKGRWMTQSPTGNKLLSYLVNQFGSEGSSEYLEDAIGGGGFPVLGGYVRPTWGDGSYGIEGNWKFGG